MFSSSRRRGKIGLLTGNEGLSDTHQHNTEYTEFYLTLKLIINEFLNDIDKYFREHNIHQDKNTKIVIPPFNDNIYTSDGNLFKISIKPFDPKTPKDWLIKLIDMIIDGLNNNTLGYKYNGNFHAFPPGEDKDDLITSLNLNKKKYTTLPTKRNSFLRLFTSNKVLPTSGGKKLLTYKLLNCSIKCSKQLFTGTSISEVIHSIANYLLPTIKNLVVTRLTILN